MRAKPNRCALCKQKVYRYMVRFYHRKQLLHARCFKKLKKLEQENVTTIESVG